MSGNLARNVSISRVMNAVADGTDDTQSSTILDMQGYEGVVFVAALGDVDNTAELTLQAQQNTANSGTGMTTLAGTSSSTADATSHDNKLLVLGVHKPLERYVRCQMVRATANATVDGVIAIRYRAREMPITQGSTVGSTTILVSPDKA